MLSPQEKGIIPPRQAITFYQGRQPQLVFGNNGRYLYSILSEAWEFHLAVKPQEFGGDMEVLLILSSEKTVLDNWGGFYLLKIAIC